MSTTPVNVQIPGDPEAPVIADFIEHALRVAYVDRKNLTKVPKGDWDDPGVYVLLTGDGSGQVYVGSARKLRQRLNQHNSNEKLPWTRAVVVKRDTTNGFNTAEIGYLEGRLSAEVASIAGIEVIEGQKSGDETLPAHMQISLDAFVKSMLAALRLSGTAIERADPDPAPEEEAPLAQVNGHRVSLRVTVGNLVSSGLLEAGQKLSLRQGDIEATASVTADGEILVRGVAYRTPSAAAAAALHLQSSNGWTTWHVGEPSGHTLDWLRQKWLQQNSKEGSA